MIDAQEGDNPSNGIVSFDNVFASALMVVVITSGAFDLPAMILVSAQDTLSANTWSDVMYSMMDADFVVSNVYFLVCLIILNFWSAQRLIPFRGVVLTRRQAHQHLRRRHH